MVEILPVVHSHHHLASSSGDVVDSGNPNIAKATAMVVLFTCSMVLGLLPIQVSKWLAHKNEKSGKADNNKYVEIMLGIGGGVLLCTTFLHLLPEVAETFESLDLTPNIELHMAELLMCIGFFLMYFVEECVHVYLHRREKQAELSPLVRSLSIRRGELDSLDSPRSSATQAPKLKEVLVGSATEKSHDQHDHRHDGHTHTHLLAGEVDSTVKAIRGLLVVLALSVHELFEGLAVGLEASAGNVWYMFGAVSAHKLVIAFCIGFELVTTRMKNFLIVIYIFTFAVVSPLGIGIGMAISNLEQDIANLVSVFLQGLACGTLLYVVFFEILQNERKSGLRQFLAVFIGFLGMLCMTII